MADETTFDNNPPANMEKTQPFWRRNSTGSMNIRVGESKAVSPRYLRAPIASCHENCKYGAKRDSGEAAEKRLESKLQTKKKFATLRLPLTPKKQKTASAEIRQVSGRDPKRAVQIEEHKNSPKTISKTNQTKARIPRKASQQSSQIRETRTQDVEEHVPEKTLHVVEEHKDNSSTNQESLCCPAPEFNVSEETELESEQDSESDPPREVELKRDDDSSSKVFFRYVLVQEKKDTTMVDTKKKPAIVDRSNNVKTLIDAFESAISQQDVNSSPLLRRSLSHFL